MIIYLAINTSTKKCYIGQTILSLEKRKQGHISESYRKVDNSYFHNSLRKYGEKSFIWFVIYKCKNKEELDEK